MKTIVTSLLQKNQIKLLAKVIVAIRGVINFRNKDQVVLFDCELSGQISDGMWGNSSPRGHYKEITRAIPKKGTPLGCMGFRPMRAYNFANSRLLSIVEDRMVWYVKLSRAFPKLSLAEINNYNYSDCNYDAACVNSDKDKGAYFQKRLKDFKKALDVKSVGQLQKALDKIKGVSYSGSNLRKDLKDMSAIIKGTAPEEEKPGREKRELKVGKLKNPSVKEMQHENKRLNSMGLSKYTKRLLTKVTNPQKMATGVLILTGNNYHEEAEQVAQKMVEMNFINKPGDVYQLDTPNY